MSNAIEELEEAFEHELWLREASPHLFRACEVCGREARNHPDVADSQCPGWYTDPRLDRKGD